MGIYPGILMLGMGMDLHLCMGMDQLLLRLHNQRKRLPGINLVHHIGLVHQGKLLEQLGQAHQLSKLAILIYTYCFTFNSSCCYCDREGGPCNKQSK